MILAGYMGKLFVFVLESWQWRHCLKLLRKEVKTMGIKIEDLTVTFRNKVTAINHADLEIPKGIFGLLGENGAGKTTLMRVLTTVLAPTSGTVTLDGMLYSEGNFEKIQRKIGYLPQEIDLYPNLSVQECLEYMGDLSGIPKQTYKESSISKLKPFSLTTPDSMLRSLYSQCPMIGSAS